MKIAIAGYGALGAATERAAFDRTGAELYGIFTRRDPNVIRTAHGTPVYRFDDIEKHKSEIDIVINCMGSAFDLPETTPLLAKSFNQIDSFDTHKNIRTHFEKTDAAAKSAGKLSLICAGWDPGLFSLARAYMKATLPKGADFTFWGEGVSRGHSNAVRQIRGVLDAVQYTVPIESAVRKVRSGDFEALTDKQLHKRVCFVVAEAGADTERIRSEIVTMPNYFADYETEVNFIDYESFLSEHSTVKHAGKVICTEKGTDGVSSMEFSLTLDSNPYFTAEVLVSFAFAVCRMNARGESGCITALDVKPGDLLDREEIFKLI